MLFRRPLNYQQNQQQPNAAAVQPVDMKAWSALLWLVRVLVSFSNLVILLRQLETSSCSLCRGAYKFVRASELVWHVLFAVVFLSITLLSTLLVGSWWRQLGVMAASLCHSWWSWWSDTLWYSRLHEVMTRLVLVRFCFGLAGTHTICLVTFTCFCGVLSAITWILFSKSNRGSMVAANHNHVSGYSRAIPQRIRGTLGWLLIDKSVVRRKVLRISRPSHVWIYNVSFHLMGMMNFTTRKAHSKCLCTPISLCFACEFLCFCACHPDSQSTVTMLTKASFLLMSWCFTLLIDAQATHDRCKTDYSNPFCYWDLSILLGQTADFQGFAFCYRPRSDFVLELNGLMFNPTFLGDPKLECGNKKLPNACKALLFGSALQFRLWCKASGLRVQRIFVLEDKIVGKS